MSDLTPPPATATFRSTPREIVAALDKHIVGQADAKRAVAIALRNRYRWRQLDESVRQEITPKNIIMMGPTGVGKTEITRRLAALTGAPFIKVEATKYTEVGYYGRDVESMIRDLVEAAITLVRDKGLGRRDLLAALGGDGLAARHGGVEIDQLPTVGEAKEVLRESA